jgi:hypothetical protein
MWLIPPSLTSQFAPASLCSISDSSLQPERVLWCTLSGKPTARPLCWRGWRTRPWSRHLFSAATFKTSNGTSCVAEWIQSQQASPASHLARPESAKAPKMNAGCGPRLPLPFARWAVVEKMGRESSIWKTSQASLFPTMNSPQGSGEFWETWPKWGLLLRGECYELPTLARHTSAPACSSWPSARAEDAECCGNYLNAADSSRQLTAAMWNTPDTAPDAPNSGSNRKAQPPGLGNQAAMWPTPTEDNVNNQGGPSRTNGMENGDFVEHLWTTPQAHDVTERGSGQQPTAAAGNACLARDARKWPTPDAMSGGAESGNRKKELGRTASGGGDLLAAVQHWPTIGANDAKGSARMGQRRGQLDEAAEQKWATPRVTGQADTNRENRESAHAGDDLTFQAEKFSPPAQPIHDGPPSSASAPDSRRRLNPAFASWLMGWPWWWTQPAPISFAPSAMASYRCKLRSLLLSLAGGS